MLRPHQISEATHVAAMISDRPWRMLAEPSAQKMSGHSQQAGLLFVWREGGGTRLARGRMGARTQGGFDEQVDTVHAIFSISAAAADVTGAQTLALVERRSPVRSGPVSARSGGQSRRNRQAISASSKAVL